MLSAENRAVGQMQQAVGLMRIGQMKVARLRPNQICRSIRASTRFSSMEVLAAGRQCFIFIFFWLICRSYLVTSENKHYF